MIDRDLWREVWQTLVSNRLRTLLTASGIFWGVFILIIMLGFGNGIEDGVNNSMSGYATNTLYVWSRRTSQPWQGLSPGRRIKLNNDDTAALLQQVPEIGTLVPRVRLSGWRRREDISFGARVTDAEVSGDIPALRNILPMTLEAGRFLNLFDVQQRRKVAVIGERIHRDLFGDDTNPIGRQIAVRGISFTVVGVFKPKRYGDDQERMASLVFTPLSTFQQVFNRGREIGFFAMVPKPGLRSAELGELIKTVLKQRHRVAPHDNRAFGSWNTEKEYLRNRNLFRGIRAFIWTVGIATLLAGVLGVSNIMLIAIRERQREFGIRKSLGATPGTVLKMILLETSTLIGIAGALGILAGLLGLAIIDVLTRAATQDSSANVLFSKPTIELHVVLIMLLALSCAALLATLIPARHAMRINPVEALRAE
jgi:putative ABC transport system permease protein